MQIQDCEVLVDDVDLWRLEVESWGIQRKSNGATQYAYVRKYECKDGHTRVRLLHREITGAQDGKVVDHINGNTLDNRRVNLRVCSQAENLRNRKRNANNTSGFKGVYFCRDKQKWRAAVRHNGKTYHAGYAKTPSDAALLYDVKARELHGEFARLNATEAVTV